MKRDRRLERLRRNPRNVAPETLRTVLEDAGFGLDRIKGSHWIFVHSVSGQTLSIPYRRPLKPVYVRTAIAAIDEVLR